MKSLVVIFALSAFVLFGCATQKGTKEDYFGYNNSPTIPENTEKPVASSKPKRSAPPVDTTSPLADDAPKDDWVNPMATDDDPQDDYLDDASQQSTAVAYQPYSSPQYVPVIIPWWDSYSGWMGGYYSRPVVVMRYRNWYWGWNSYCDWYSPYYDYHPWYGGNFSYYRPRYYGWNRNYWRPWHHYPIYTYGHTNPTPAKPNSVRNWGPTRGETPPASGGVRGTVTSPNPTSNIPNVRNERGQGSGSPSTKSTTTIPTGSSITPAIRNERGNSSASSPQSGTQLPNKRSETSPTSGTPKSSSNPNTSSTPVRNERTTKEATPTPKSDPKPSSSGTSAPRQERSSAPSQSASPAPRSSTPSAAPSTPTTNSPRGTRKP